MTRDEAKKHFWTDTDEFGESVSKRFGSINYQKIFTGYYIGSEIDKFIDKIYDDFESRTCENCKYSYKGYAGLYCNNFTSDILYVDRCFGCNKFERITK